MKITMVKYGLTLSLGNYESERIDLEAQVDEGETPEEVLKTLRSKVYGMSTREQKSKNW